MKLSIVAIGDELLIGQVTDTNSGAIACIIEPHGWSVDSVNVVGDNSQSIRSAIDTAFTQTDIVVTTGGLGPTKDDITKQVLLDIFGGELRFDNDVLDNVKDIFQKRGLKLNALTESQAMVPTSCRVIQNKVGTAPILWFENDEKILVSLPGVPFECVQMFEQAVFPQLLAKFSTDTYIGHRCVILTGITESDAAEALDEWERELPDCLHLAYLPKMGMIRLRLDGKHSDSVYLEELLDSYHTQLISMFPGKLLAKSDITPVEALLSELRSKGLTLSTAESCTGGNIAHTVTSIAGCSDVYMGSVVSYFNDVKIKLLGVDASLIDAYGVVSEPVVAQMAIGATKAIATDCAIATSGIAGPSGGTPTKPVGTVCISVAYPFEGETRVIAKTMRFPGTRERVIERATTAAIVMLTMALRDSTH